MRLLTQSVGFELRLFFLLFVFCVGCSHAEPTPKSISTLQQKSAGNQPSVPWGGLDVATSGVPLGDASQVLVMLHGYGASREDLMPLAAQFRGESRAFVFANAPVELPSGGKAWWTSDAQFMDAERQVVLLVKFLNESYPEAQVSIGGFSQGATLASALIPHSELAIEHLVLYSPELFLDAAQLPENIQPFVFLSHGRSDNVLPFAGSRRLQEMLTRKGCKVNWHAFDGGHTITAELIDATREQLDGRQ